MGLLRQPTDHITKPLALLGGTVRLHDRQAGEPPCPSDSAFHRHDEKPYRCIPGEPRQVSLGFLIGSGAQISVLNKQQVEKCGIKLPRKGGNTGG